MSSLISFFKELKVLSYRSELVWLVLPQDILFDTIVKGEFSLISFSAHLSLVYRRVIGVFFLSKACILPHLSAVKVS